VERIDYDAVCVVVVAVVMQLKLYTQSKSLTADLQLNSFARCHYRDVIHTNMAYAIDSLTGV